MKHWYTVTNPWKKWAQYESEDPFFYNYILMNDWIEFVKSVIKMFAILYNW